MCRRLIYLCSFVLGLGLVLTSIANAADPNLVGWWKFDGDATDSSGNNKDGTLLGNPAWVTGMIGGALSFDSINDIMTVGDDPSLDLEDALTISLWVKPPDVVTPNHMVTKQPSGTAPDNYPGNYEFRVKDNTIQFLHQTSESTDYNLYLSTSQITAGEWHHAAVTVAEGGLVEFYLDGLPAGSTPQLGTFGVLNDNSLRVGGRKDSRFFNGVLDDVLLYNRALTQEEIQVVMEGLSVDLASNPIPADETTDVPRQVALNWTPGEFAGQHDVYFGTSFDDVNDATATVDPANVYRGRQSANSYAVGETLDLGQTYYWRIDEVNAPPTSHVVFKGDLWQFTVEPVGYPMPSENIIATASSSFDASTGPEKTVDGSGLDDDDLHSERQPDVWLTGMTAQPPIWIQYEFDKVYKLHEMWVWNFNQVFEPIVGFGLKDVTIEYSANGADWTGLAGVPEFARAPGMPGYAHDTTVDFGGAAAKYVKITANDNWGFLNQYGLSEVRFFYVPVQAREPDPDSGATDVGLDATLGFRAGREAAKHNVYLSTNEQAVIDGTAPVTTVTEAGHGPLALDLGKTYYWRVDEVNEAETPATWEGNIWDFATQEYFVVEDFEAYDDYEPNRLFDTWTDGWGVATNGATMGYPNPIFVLDEHFVETTIVHDGSQSAPLFYDNTAGATYSEATRTVDAPRDWIQAGVKALTLWFHGDPNNSATEQMYVKLNGSKVTYDGDADNLTRTGWQLWYIDLAGLGVNLTNVTELTIGLERNGVIGGKGVVYFDDIRLSPYDRQLVTPAEPNTAGLVAHYEFEGTTGDSSGNGLHGTAMGEPVFVAGKIGQAISLDGVDDYVEITGYKGILGPNAVTVTAWVRTSSTATGAIVGWGPNVAGQRFGFRVNAGRLRMEHHGGNVQGDSNVNDGGWHHVAVTVEENATISYPEVILWLDGLDDTRPTTDPDAYNITAAEDVSIGRRPASNDRFFMGQIDDVRIYDRALSPEEIAWSAGRTKPFDKPLRSP